MFTNTWRLNTWFLFTRDRNLWHICISWNSCHKNISWNSWHIYISWNSWHIYISSNPCSASFYVIRTWFVNFKSYTLNLKKNAVRTTKTYMLFMVIVQKRSDSRGSEVESLIWKTDDVPASLHPLRVIKSKHWLKMSKHTNTAHRRNRPYIS